MSAEQNFSDRPLVLEPLNEFLIAKHYDLGMGYVAHHIHCMQAGGAAPRDTLTPLLRKGYEVIPATNRGTANSLTNLIRDTGEAQFQASDIGQDQLRALFHLILAGVVDQRIRTTLLSNYAVVFANFCASKSGTESVSSFWHCDGGPKSHLKLMIYLNEASEHDGGTEFLDCDTTRLFSKIGYIHCPLIFRQPDLSEAAYKYGISFEPELVCPEIGEAAIFHSGQVLHKAHKLTRGTRYTLTLIIVPSASDWSAYYDQGGFDVLQRNTTGAFPDVSVGGANAPSGGDGVRPEGNSATLSYEEGATAHD